MLLGEEHSSQQTNTPGSQTPPAPDNAKNVLVCGDCDTSPVTKEQNLNKLEVDLSSRNQHSSFLPICECLSAPSATEQLCGICLCYPVKAFREHSSVGTDC